MKRVRIFLGAALVLAVASAFAVKANTADITVFYQVSEESCVSTTIPDPNCPGTTGAICTHNFGSGAQTIYKNGTATTCSNEFRKLP